MRCLMKILIKAIKGIFWVIYAWQIFGLLPVLTWVNNLSAVTPNMWFMVVFKLTVLIVCYFLYRFFDKKYKSISTTNASDRINEEEVYKQALEEIEQKTIRSGIWAKALAKSEGEESKAKALYISYRVQSIKDELEISHLLKKEKEAEEKKLAILNQEKRIRKCVDSLIAMEYKVKSKKDCWVVYDYTGMERKIIKSIDELELLLHKRKHEENDNSKYDKWTGTIDDKKIKKTANDNSKNQDFDDSPSGLELVSFGLVFFIVIFYFILAAL